MKRLCVDIVSPLTDREVSRLRNVLVQACPRQHTALEVVHRQSDATHPILHAMYASPHVPLHFLLELTDDRHLRVFDSQLRLGPRGLLGVLLPH